MSLFSQKSKLFRIKNNGLKKSKLLLQRTTQHSLYKTGSLLKGNNSSVLPFNSNNAKPFLPGFLNLDTSNILLYDLRHLASGTRRKIDFKEKKRGLLLKHFINYFIFKHKKYRKVLSSSTNIKDFLRVVLLSLITNSPEILTSALSHELSISRKHKLILALVQKFIYIFISIKIFRKLFRLEGVLIKVKGRVNGVDRKKTVWVKEGPVPLQTLKSVIDYSYKPAISNSGKVSIHVWYYINSKQNA